MAAKSRRKRRTSSAANFQASTALVGTAFTMPESSVLAAAEGPPIDFQARQDSISQTRRRPDEGLVPEVKRTSVEPADTEETTFEP